MRSGRVEFHAVPLAVAEGHGVRLEALGLRDGERGGGVESATEEDDCFGVHV